jgi:hypothetical protein
MMLGSEFYYSSRFQTGDARVLIKKKGGSRNRGIKNGIPQIATSYKQQFYPVMIMLNKTTPRV